MDETVQTAEKPARKIIVEEELAPELVKKFRHRYQPGQMLKSGDGRAMYRVDEETGAFKRLNPKTSKKARRKAEQKARRNH